MGLGILVSGRFDARAQEASFRVFDTYQGSPDHWMKYRHIDNAWYDQLGLAAERYLTMREIEVNRLAKREDWERRKRFLKTAFLESIGGLPEKTPLNAQTLEVLERETFRVEKVLYESLPGFYVTACLFLPKERPQPAPAIIYCSGHTADGFRSSTYQHVILNLVQKGFVVLAFDPLGQGERYQYLDENGRPDIGGPTGEHSYAGMQCLLTGTSIARYMIHDGIRAVDYLLSRPEVDPARIGVTGRSGGGTQSAYLAAFDERIYAAAPENYLTSFRRLWASIGPQDAEQDLPGSISRGIDHADLLEVRVPKPALMLTTSRDFFSIQGARETYAEVKEVYALYGAAQNLAYAEDDHGHGSTRANREALYAFFQRHLGLPGDPEDEETEPFSAEALTVTATGQVGSALDAKTVYDLNLEYLSSRQNQAVSGADLAGAVREIAGMSSPVAAFRAVLTGRYQMEGYQLEKYFLEFEEARYPVPFLWLTPAAGNTGKAVLYLDSRGKPAGIAPGGALEQLIRAGHSVLAADVLHTGELASTSFRGDSQFGDVSFNLPLGGSLVGKSLVGFQADDIAALATFVRDRPGYTDAGIIGMADGELGVSLLHAAVAGVRFDELILTNLLVSWREWAYTYRYLPRLAHTLVPGAMLFYDLPDLLVAAAPARLKIIDPVNAGGRKLNATEAAAAYETVIRHFDGTGRRDRLEIVAGE